MDTSLHVFAPAKLNLFLELLDKRTDGYHEIETVMVTLDRGDSLQVARRDAPGVELLEATWLPGTWSWHRRGVAVALPTSADNLVVRALMRFAQHFRVDHGYSVRLFKRIPAAAGLGGASSDAAAVLRAAARLSGLHPKTDELRGLAAEVGSDVPFFLSADRVHAAVATGRGEKIRPISLSRRWSFVVAYPPDGLSTAAVYAASRVPVQARSAEPLIAGLQNGNARQVYEAIFNRLQAPADASTPWVSILIKQLKQVGAAAAALTGSGSACFGIFADVRSARRAAARLNATGSGLAFPASSHGKLGFSG
jgi:4-diphosphocytidyl-2-C-methyl-D-erythritol kinase